MSTPALAQAEPLPEFRDVTRERFEAEIRPLARPAVLRGLAADWPAVAEGRRSGAAVLAYLTRFARPDPVPVKLGPPEIDGLFGYEADLTRLNFARMAAPMRAIFERLLGEAASPRPHAIAIQSAVIPDDLPGFERENRTALLGEEVRPRIWIGNACRVSTHSDPMENLAVTVAGRRRFVLFPPDQVANLYLGPLHLTPSGTPVSLVDPDEPDPERFPRFAEAWAAARSAVLEPGDAIYIPFLWYHNVRSLDPVSILVNYWWKPAAVEGPGIGDAMLFARAAFAGLPADQREAWRALFDHYVFGDGGEATAHLPPHVRGPLAPLAPRQAQQLRQGLAALVAQLGRPAG